MKIDGFNLSTAYHFILKFTQITTVCIASDTRGYTNINVKSLTDQVQMLQKFDMKTPVESFDLDFNTGLATIVLEGAEEDEA